MWTKRIVTMAESNDVLVLFKTSRFLVIGRSDDQPQRQQRQQQQHLLSMKAIEQDGCHHDHQDNHNINLLASSAANNHHHHRHHIFLDINEPYTRQMIQNALNDRGISFTLGPGFGTEEVIMPQQPPQSQQQQLDCTFQWAEYERIDWNAVLAGRHGASSYCVRKGLSRKAQLAYYTKRYINKHPDSILRHAIPTTILLDTWSVWEETTTNNNNDGKTNILMMMMNGINNTDTDTTTNEYSHDIRQRLAQCLAHAKQIMSHAEDEFEKGITSSPPIWILKPSTINKGAGIQIVHLYEQVLDICWQESDIREWVLQQYISPPLLLQGRKFHIRAYAVAVSAIRVYLCHDCLALCSGTRYHNSDTTNYLAHITNTAYQEQDANFDEETCVRRWTVEDVGPILVQDGTCRDIHHARRKIRQVMSSMEQITAELFRAYQNEFSVFCPIEGCFEQYGLDFMVNDHWQVYLLEVNPGPDFKQTGSRLSKVIERLMGDTIDVALQDDCNSSSSTIDPPQQRVVVGSLHLVYEHQVRSHASSSSNKESGINMRLM